MMSRLGFDLLAALILTATAAFGAYMPVVLSQRDRKAGGTGRSLTLVLGNMFSAGVMVSAGFCHLLGEAVKQMPAMQFSLATFLCGLGYLLTLCADKAATILSGVSPASDEGMEVKVGVDLAERIVGTPGRSSRVNGGGVSTKDRYSDANEHLGLLPLRGGSSDLAGSSSSPRFRAGGLVGGLGGGIVEDEGDNGSADIETGSSGRAAFGLGGGRLTTRVPPTPDVEEEFSSLPTLDGIICSTSPSGDGSSSSGAAATHQRYVRPGLSSGNGAPPLHLQQQQHGGSSRSHHGCAAPPTAVSVTFITAVLMAVALCFHSVLEGAAMGAQPDITNSLHIFIAIVSHKGLAAYALGSSIVESGVELRRFWAVVLPFTFASPVGIFLGYIVSDAAQGTGAAAISALASGTFLYVAFMEVIPRELHDPRKCMAKLGALLLGFGLMSVLAIWA